MVWFLLISIVSQPVYGEGACSAITRAFSRSVLGRGVHKIKRRFQKRVIRQRRSQGRMPGTLSMPESLVGHFDNHPRLRAFDNAIKNDADGPRMYLGLLPDYYKLSPSFYDVRIALRTRNGESLALALRDLEQELDAGQLALRSWKQNPAQFRSPKGGPQQAADEWVNYLFSPEAEAEVLAQKARISRRSESHDNAGKLREFYTLEKGKLRAHVAYTVEDGDVTRREIMIVFQDGGKWRRKAYAEVRNRTTGLSKHSRGITCLNCHQVHPKTGELFSSVFRGEKIKSLLKRGAVALTRDELGRKRTFEVADEGHTFGRNFAAQESRPFREGRQKLERELAFRERASREIASNRREGEVMVTWIQNHRAVGKPLDEAFVKKVATLFYKSTAKPSRGELGGIEVSWTRLSQKEKNAVYARVREVIRRYKKLEKNRGVYNSVIDP